MDSTDSVDLTAQVCAALDPVVTAHGFAAGQSGAHQVTFCAAFDDFADRYPALPQATGQERDRGACVDLVVTVDDAGRLDHADLEGRALAVTLEDMGRQGDAATAAAAVGQPVAEALPALVSAVTALLD